MEGLEACIRHVDGRHVLALNLLHFTLSRPPSNSRASVMELVSRFARLAKVVFNVGKRVITPLV